MNFKTHIAVLFITTVSVVAFGETFFQSGHTLLYQGKNSKSPTAIPVNIIIDGAQSTVNDRNGNFTLRFNNAKAGDLLKNINVQIPQNQYVWFNKENVSQWVLTSNKSLPIEICPKKLIDDLSATYSNNYVRWLTRKYEQEQENLRKAIEDVEELTTLLNDLKQRYQRDVSEVKLRSIEFAYVDETQLDSVEIELRKCYLDGNIEKAIAIVNELNLSGILKDLGDNLSKSHARAISDASALYRYVIVSDNHLRNLQASGEPNDSLRGLFENIIPYYEQLVNIYSPDNLKGLRCSDEFYDNLKIRYGRLLFEYDKYFIDTYSREIHYNPTEPYDTDNEDRYLLRAVELGDIQAMYKVYSNIYYIDPLQSKQLNGALIKEVEKRGYSELYSQILGLEHNLGNLYEDFERHPSFKTNIGNDSAYFTIVAPGKVSLVKWVRKDRNNKRIKVPQEVKFEGETYTVTKIGKEALGAMYYGKAELEVCEIFDGVIEIKLPDTIEYLSSDAIGARFWSPQKVNLPKSIKFLNDYALPIGCFLDKRGSLKLPEGFKYLGNLWTYCDEEDPIKTLIIPASVEGIGCMDYSPKFNIYAVENLIVDERNKHFMTVGNVLYTKDGSHLFLGSLYGKKTLFIPDSLNLKCSDIEDFLENSYFGHHFIGRHEELIVSPGNPYMENYNGTLCNRQEGSVIFANGETLSLPPYASKASPQLACIGPTTLIVASGSDPQNVISVISDLDYYGGFNLERIEIAGEEISIKPGESVEEAISKILLLSQ